MFTEALNRRADEGRPIRVGLIGAGKFGAGLVAQVAQMRGMEVSAIADIDLERARESFRVSGVGEDAVPQVSSVGQMSDAVRRGGHAVTEDGLLITECEDIDVVVEATGVPEVGARMAHAAITQGKHVIMVNVEADVTVGATLRRLADRNGVVYSLVDGDQPGCVLNMVDWARTLGFEIVAAGRGTVFYSTDRGGTPDTVPERFGFDNETLCRRTINLKMFNSFRDGTKAQVEMCAVANATGLVPEVRGMHEPPANLEDIPRLFSLCEEGGLLRRHGVVELANSVGPDGSTLLPNPLRMGVFVVIRAEHPFLREDLANYHLPVGGDGRNFLLYRPYHLVAVEAPISIAMAALHGRATGSAMPIPVADVITVAKRNLKRGEKLDGGGGYTVYGLIERAEVARTQNLLPLGLSNGATLKQDVSQGDVITCAMVELNKDSFVFKLRREQDEVTS